MFDAQIQLMRFTRDLLKHDEQLIKRGRVNEEQELSTIDYIAVDSLTSAMPITKRQSYDEVNEIVTYGLRFRQSFTLDFYGNNAYKNASEFAILINGHISQRLQKQYNITVGSASAIIDLKLLTGREYVNRYQVEVMLQYEKSVSQELYRIEVVPFEVATDNDLFREVEIDINKEE